MQKEQLKSIFHKRLYILAILILIMLSIIIIKFFYVQIIQHNYFEKKANNNRVKIVAIPPARGLIFDRNNRILAENKITLNLEIDQSKKNKIDKIVTQLKPFISISKKDLSQYEKIIKNNYFSTTIPLKTDLTPQEAAKFLANEYQINDVYLKSRLKRYYQHHEITSHVVGYINRINKKDLRMLTKKNRLWT